MKNLIIIWILFMAALPVYGHESHGFKHMVESSGLIIEMKWCPSATQLWSIDNDSNDIIDKCVQVIFTHDRFHVLDLPIHIVDGKQTCICKESE